MLRRVVAAVMASGRVGRTIVAIEPDSIDEAQGDPRPAPRRRGDRICPSRENIGASVAAVAERGAAAARSSPPATTRSTPPRWSPIFCDALDGVDEDGALGLTPADYVLDKYPEGNRAFHRFRDGAFFSLQPLRDPHAARARRRPGVQLRRPVRQEAEAADRRVRPRSPSCSTRAGCSPCAPVLRALSRAHRGQHRAGADAVRRRADRRRPPGRLGPRQPHRRRARSGDSRLSRPTRAPKPPHCENITPPHIGCA